MTVLAIRNYFGNYLSRARCWATGHVRGVRLFERDAEEPGVDHFECPRCMATWTRKARKPKAEGSAH